MTTSLRCSVRAVPCRAANVAVLLAAAIRSDLPHDRDMTMLLHMAAGTVIYRRPVGRTIDAGLIDELTELIHDAGLPAGLILLT